MARDHALGAWGKASPAVMGSTENCDPQTSISAPARGSEKPERPPQPTCSHCYKRFKTAEQLTEHVAKANHSRHDPRCGVCGKHFANLDTLRQHLVGQLPNKACAARFRVSGCPLCLAVGAPGERAHARTRCPFEIDLRSRDAESRGETRPRAVALDCEMVGVEPDGGGAMCVRVCVVDDRGETLLNTFVEPSAPVTDYRAELTGVDEESAPRVFAGAPSLREAREMVLNILNPTAFDAVTEDEKRDRRDAKDETDERAAPSSTTRPAPPLVVGHDLAHDLACLGIESSVPERRRRDTARYAPFQRHTHKPYKLRVLAKELLNATIQAPNQAHDPREDAVAAMRLYAGGRAMCRLAREGETRARDGDTRALETEARFRCWCLDGCSDGTSPLASRSPSRARSAAAVVAAPNAPSPSATAKTARAPTEAARAPKRALRDATNA